MGLALEKCADADLGGDFVATLVETYERSQFKRSVMELIAKCFTKLYISLKPQFGNP
jgi:hypothetical protein